MYSNVNLIVLQLLFSYLQHEWGPKHLLEVQRFSTDLA